MVATVLPSVCAGRPGTAFGIPCFHTEFPVVRGAKCSKEHSIPRNPWNPCRECSKEHGVYNHTSILVTIGRTIPELQLSDPF